MKLIRFTNTDGQLVHVALDMIESVTDGKHTAFLTLASGRTIDLMESSTEAVNHINQTIEDASIPITVDLRTLVKTPAPQPARPMCSVCKDVAEDCSMNYSGGWSGIPCPSRS